MNANLFGCLAMDDQFMGTVMGTLRTGYVCVHVWCRACRHKSMDTLRVRSRELFRDYAGDGIL